MQSERRVAVNPQTKPTDLGCEFADRLLSSDNGELHLNKQNCVKIYMLRIDEK